MEETFAASSTTRSHRPHSAIADRMRHHEALRLHAIVLWAAAVTVAGTTLAAGLPIASTFAGLARAMPSGKLLYLTAADTAEDDFARKSC